MLLPFSISGSSLNHAYLSAFCIIFDISLHYLSILSFNSMEHQFYNPSSNLKVERDLSFCCKETADQRLVFRDNCGKRMWRLCRADD